jgi:hypothetical protein
MADTIPARDASKPLTVVTSASRPESCDVDAGGMTKVETVTYVVTTTGDGLTVVAPGLGVAVSTVGAGTFTCTIGDNVVVGLGAADTCPACLCHEMNEYDSSPTPMSSNNTAKTAAVPRRRRLAGSVRVVDPVMPATPPFWLFTHSTILVHGWLVIQGQPADIARGSNAAGAT